MDAPNEVKKNGKTGKGKTDEGREVGTKTTERMREREGGKEHNGKFVHIPEVDPADLSSSRFEVKDAAVSGCTSEPRPQTGSQLSVTRRIGL